jgi:nucleotide-binding universal stress UspA family protein
VTDSDGAIVVGVDGSDASKDALQWAARQARLTGSRLLVVMAWHVPSLAYGGVVALPVDLDLEGDSRKVLDQVIADTLGDHPDVETSALVVEGSAALELIELAAGAELLVVGNRGHGAFTGMLLGSVSEHCVAHAPCPVVVVRHSNQPA